ncbi:MAG: hypothetical protein GYB66_00150, partial [Chloroflexi bacterium]|nr:hypothetical protein [Chloroflexota bacterium]
MPPFLLSIAERYLRPAFFTAVNFMSWAPRLALSRLIAKWRSLLTIVVGVVLGAGIGALVPLYTTAVAQVGLVQRLDEEPAHDSNARLRIALRPFDFASMDDVLAAATLIEEDYIQATVDEYLATETLEGWVTSNDVSPYLETDKMGVMEDEETPLRSLNANDNSRASLIYLQDWQDEVRVVEGQLPAEAAVPDGVDFNVAISTTVANTFGLQTGDVLIVDQRRSRNGSLNSGAWETSQPFTVHITAIIAPGDEESAFWMALRGEDDTPLNVIRGSWPAEFRMLADRDTVISVMQDFVPQTPLTFGWRFLFNHEELPYSRITEARTALRDFEAVLFGDLGQDNPELASQVGLAEGRADLQLQYDYDTRLVDFSQTREDVDEGILLDYDEKQETNAVPFTLLLLEVGALVLFFLIVTAALVRRGERREIAMLQSRGAFDSHILALRGIEALLICLFGAIAAPFIAQQLLILLGPSVAGTDEFPL